MTNAKTPEPGQMRSSDTKIALDKATRNLKISLSAVAVISSLGALVSTFVGTLEALPRVAGDIRAGVRVQREMSLVQAEIKSIKASIAQRGSAPLPPKFAEVNDRLAKVEQAQAQINEAILATPGKALELPLLKRDVEDLKARNLETAAALRGEIERVYSLAQWLIGALSLGVLALAAQAFIKKS